MEFGGDDRAVAVQIGAVLLLGFVVVSLSMYQATVVPQENEQVEFQHSQRVVGDMQQVRNAIHQTAATGASAPATVELGTNYPARSVFVNPSPPGGTVSTSGLGNVSVRNALADDPDTSEADFPETDDFWNGETRNYSTRALAYRPTYNRYQNAPTTVYENGVLYNRFGEGDDANAVTVTDQTLVSGRRINLVTLSGELSRGGTGTLSLDPRARSQSTRTVSVSQDPTRPGNVSVVVPTRLDAETWERLLTETNQYDGTGDPTNERYVHAVNDAGGDAVEIVFESGTTYELRMANVGVGSGDGTAEPAYLTSADGIDFPYAGQKEPFVVEVRDRYNNPVGTSVSASAARGTVPNGTVEEPGRYRYVYDAPDDAGTDTVNVSYLDESRPAFDPDSPEDLQHRVEVQTAGGGSDDGGDADTSAIDASMNVNDNSNPSRIKASVQVNAADADGDDDIQRITIELVDDDDQVLDTTTRTYGGVGSATHNGNFNEARGRNPHVIRVTVVDADSNVEEVEQRIG